MVPLEQTEIQLRQLHQLSHFYTKVMAPVAAVMRVVTEVDTAADVGVVVMVVVVMDMDTTVMDTMVIMVTKRCTCQG